MQALNAGRNWLSAVYTPVDVAQHKRGQELEDRLDRLLGRGKGPDVSLPRPRTLSPHHTESAGNSVGNSVNPVPAPAQRERKLCTVLPQEEAPSTKLEPAKAHTPREQSSTVRGDEEDASANSEAASGASPSESRGENTSGDATRSSSQDGNGRYGTVKSLKNLREIDFSVKFVDKRRRKSSAKAA